LIIDNRLWFELIVGYCKKEEINAKVKKKKIKIVYNFSDELESLFKVTHEYIPA